MCAAPIGYLADLAGSRWSSNGAFAASSTVAQQSPTRQGSIDARAAGARTCRRKRADQRCGSWDARLQLGGATDPRGSGRSDHDALRGRPWPAACLPPTRAAMDRSRDSPGLLMQHVNDHGLGRTRKSPGLTERRRDLRATQPSHARQHALLMRVDTLHPQVVLSAACPSNWPYQLLGLTLVTDRGQGREEGKHGVSGDLCGGDRRGRCGGIVGRGVVLRGGCGGDGRAVPGLPRGGCWAMM